MQILMSVKQELVTVMRMQSAITLLGVMSVPATRDMVAMDYLAQVQLLCVIVTHVTILTSVFYCCYTIHCSNL